MEHRSGQPYHVMPLDEVEDIGHLTEVESDDPGWFTSDAPSVAIDECYLCERGICVRRVVQVGWRETLIVHGAYEA